MLGCHLRVYFLLTAKQAKWLEQCITALLMSLLLSFSMLFIGSGITDIFFQQWMKTWALAFAIALPTSMLIAPFIKRSVAKITL